MRRTGRQAVAAMFLANGIATGAWAPQIPLLLARHGIGRAEFGLLILVLGVGAVSAMLFSGRLLARKGPRRMLALSSVLAVLALPAVVLAPDLWLLVPAMALFGALLGTMDVAMNASAVVVERRMGRAIMSSSHGFWSLGGFIGGALGGLALERYGAVPQALGVAAAMLALALAAMRWLPPDPEGAAAVSPPGAVRGLLPRDPGLWMLGALALACMVPEGAVLDWSALYLQQELGADAATTGLAYALFAGAMAVMRFAGDAVRNRFGAVGVLRASGLAGAAGLAVAAMAPVPAVAIAGFALTGLGVANMVPVMFSAAGNWPGLPAGAGIPAVTLMGYSGILVAPSSIGFVAEHMGFRLTFAVLAGLLLLVIAGASRAAAADGPQALPDAECGRV